jgi:hypothetical protein
MLCPNCGTQTTMEQKFCRSCGMNLEPVSKVLAAHFAQSGGTEARAVEDERRARDDERRAVSRMSRDLLLGVAVVFAAILLVSSVGLPALGLAYKLLALVTILLGALISTQAVLPALRSLGRRRRAARLEALEGGKATGPLLHESTIEPVPSVTERTTDLLGVEVNRAKPR